MNLYLVLEKAFFLNYIIIIKQILNEYYFLTGYYGRTYYYYNNYYMYISIFFTLLAVNSLSITRKMSHAFFILCPKKSLTAKIVNNDQSYLLR